MLPKVAAVATDLDGTVLGPGGRPSRRTLDVWHRLNEHQIPVIVATARPPRSVRAVRPALPLREPVIAYNGAIVFTPDDGGVWFHETIPARVARTVVQALRSVLPGANLGLEVADRWYLDRQEPWLDQARKEGWLTAEPALGRIEQALADEGGASKIYLVAKPERARQVEEALRSSPVGNTITVTSSGQGFVEISAAGVSKGAALRRVSRRMDLALQRVVYVGDGRNDLSAFTAAGFAVAMGQADPEVRRAADAVTGSVAEDGWGEAMERYVLRSRRGSGGPSEA